MLIKLKPQWQLGVLDDGNCHLLSEMSSLQYPATHQPLLEKLYAGTDSDDLTDEEFVLLQTLNDAGLVASTTDANAPVWELHGAQWQHVQQQFRHTTVAVVDRSANAVGFELATLLAESGIQIVSEKATLTLVVADSIRDVPDQPGVSLPIIVGRVRTSIGPYIFPWRREVPRDLVGASYLSQPRYSLPVAFQRLELGVIAVQVLQVIALSRPVLVNNMVEFNMITQERTVWPIQQ